jgi:hypothetical protein
LHGKKFRRTAKLGTQRLAFQWYLSLHRTRVAANEEPDMSHVLPSRQKSIRTYAAVALFLAVYLGALIVVFAPKDMISVRSGAVIAEAD